MQELEEPRQRCERGRARVTVALVKPGLDRLQVPVTEVVEGDPIERLRHVGEVE